MNFAAYAGLFDGVYRTDRLRRALNAVPNGHGAVLAFRESGSVTTVTANIDGVEICASLEVDWARGCRCREVTAEELADLAAGLDSHGQTVWVAIKGNEISLNPPTT